MNGTSSKTIVHLIDTVSVFLLFLHRRGGRVVDGSALEMRQAGQTASRVRIPPSPRNAIQQCECRTSVRRFAYRTLPVKSVLLKGRGHIRKKRRSLIRIVIAHGQNGKSHAPAWLIPPGTCSCKGVAANLVKEIPSTPIGLRVLPISESRVRPPFQTGSVHGEAVYMPCNKGLRGRVSIYDFPNNTYIYVINIRHIIGG